jgi:hypothetical protein
MSEVKTRRCHECGIGQIQPQARAGRFARYKNLMSLEIPESLPIPTCDNCGAEWLDERTAKDIDAALSSVYAQILRRRAITVIESILQKISARKLEDTLGITPDYLSKLRAGEHDPSPELVSELALIATDPKSRIQELEQFWANEQPA